MTIRDRAETPQPSAFKRYTVCHEAYYWSALNKDMDSPYEIGIGIDSRDGGTFGEFSIRWYTLGRTASPRLEMFDESWWIIAECPGLFMDLAEKFRENNPVGVDSVIAILKHHGFEDSTERVNPYKVEDAKKPKSCPVCGAKS